MKKVVSFILAGFAASCAHPIPTQMANYCSEIGADYMHLDKFAGYPHRVTVACYSPVLEKMSCASAAAQTIADALESSSQTCRAGSLTQIVPYAIDGQLTAWSRENMTSRPSMAQTLSPVVGGMVAAAGGDPTPFFEYVENERNGTSQSFGNIQNQENCYRYANANDLDGFQACQLRNANNTLNSIANGNISSAGSNSDFAETDTCRPASDACELVQKRGEEYVSRVQAGQVAGIVDATSKAYCANAVGLEAYNFCSSEYRREGRQVCAEKAMAQADSMRKQMSSLAKAASDASITNARNACDFELH